MEYSTKEDMEMERESLKDSLPRKAESAAQSDNWQQDWREERANATQKVKKLKNKSCMYIKKKKK